MGAQEEGTFIGEYFEAYTSVQRRLAGLVRASDAGTPVPACPGWRVRDTLAHLAGVCEDWVKGRLDGYGSERWTADQVSRFEHHTGEEIVQAWADAMVPFAALREPVQKLPPAAWAFGDAV